MNSLRGGEKFNGALQVSEIYREAAPFYFDDDAALRAHLKKYAGEDVAKLLKKTDETRYNRYERDLADLSKGERGPGLLNLEVDYGDFRGPVPLRTRPNYVAQRLIEERNEKLYRAWRRGIRTGQVIVGDGDLNEVGKLKEVEWTLPEFDDQGAHRSNGAPLFARSTQGLTRPCPYPDRHPAGSGVRKSPGRWAGHCGAYDPV